MKKRLLILNICVVLAAIATFAYVVINGGEYTLKPQVFVENSKMVEAKLECESEGVVELTDAYFEGSAVVFKLKAVGKGHTKGVINYTSQYGVGGNINSNTLSVDLKVNSLGVIIDRSMGLSFTGYRVAIFSILFIFLITELITLWIYGSAIIRGKFSYSMVSFGGIGVFTLAIQAFIIYKLLNNSVHTFMSFLLMVCDTGNLLFLFLTPVMLVMAAFLAFSNIWLMRHEGYRPANALGIVFAFLWFLATVLILGIRFDIFLYSLPGVVVVILEFAACYLECMFIATAVSAFLATRFKAPMDKDYIIILGCRIRKDGSLTPLLKGRVDKALVFEKAQYEKTGKHAVFVPSGGQGPDEVTSEGAAMERYLLDQGVPAERVKREDRSENTLQNMQFSKAVIEADCGDISGKKVAFSTTNYHVFRGYILAKGSQCGNRGQEVHYKDQEGVGETSMPRPAPGSTSCHVVSDTSSNAVLAPVVGQPSSLTDLPQI